MERLRQALSLNRFLTIIHSLSIYAPSMTGYHARHWNKAMYMFTLLLRLGPKSNVEERL